VGSLQRSPDPYIDLRGLVLKEGLGNGREKERRGEEKWHLKERRRKVAPIEMKAP